MIRIGFGGPLYYIVLRNPEDSMGNYLGPYISVMKMVKVMYGTDDDYGGGDDHCHADRVDDDADAYSADSDAEANADEVMVLLFCLWNLGRKFSASEFRARGVRGYGSQSLGFGLTAALLEPVFLNFRNHNETLNPKMPKPKDTQALKPLRP